MSKPNLMPGLFNLAKRSVSLRTSPGSNPAMEEKLFKLKDNKHSSRINCCNLLRDEFKLEH